MHAKTSAISTEEKPQQTQDNQKRYYYYSADPSVKGNILSKTDLDERISPRVIVNNPSSVLNGTLAVYDYKDHGSTSKRGIKHSIVNDEFGKFEIGYDQSSDRASQKMVIQAITK